MKMSGTTKTALMGLLLGTTAIAGSAQTPKPDTAQNPKPDVEQLYNLTLQLHALEERIQADNDIRRDGKKIYKQYGMPKKERARYEAAAKGTVDLIEEEQERLGFTNEQVQNVSRRSRADYVSGIYTEADKDDLVTQSLQRDDIAQATVLEKYGFGQPDPEAEKDSKPKKEPKPKKEKGKRVKHNKSVNCLNPALLGQRTFLPDKGASVTLNNFFADAQEIVGPEGTAYVGYEAGSYRGNFTLFFVDDNFETIAKVKINNARATEAWSNRWSGHGTHVDGTGIVQDIINGGFDILTGKKTVKDAATAAGQSAANRAAGAAGHWSTWSQKFENGNAASIQDFLGTIRIRGSLDAPPIMPYGVIQDLRAQQGSIDQHIKEGAGWVNKIEKAQKWADLAAKGGAPTKVDVRDFMTEDGKKSLRRDERAFAEKVRGNNSDKGHYI